MTESIAMAELWRGEFLECVHYGDAVVCDQNGEIIQAWGDADKTILPRSSSKMIQALPLIESGAARQFDLREDQLALSCASHQAAHIHTGRVKAWLEELGLSDSDLRCGPQEPNDRAAKHSLIQAKMAPCQYHNNCSGKHTGFLTVAKHLKSGPEYIDPSHPVQRAVREAFEDVTDQTSQGFGIDGCSAPNFSTSLSGLAKAMAFFATAQGRTGARDLAADRLLKAMLAFPELVAGEEQACTELMRATGGKVALKGGAEGVYVAIIPKLGIGVALKIRDGASRGSETAIASILAHLGVLDRAHPIAAKYLERVQTNLAGNETGILRSAAGFPV